jgi:hypothetical protein
MSAEKVVAIAFLIMSGISMTWQGSTLWRLVRDSSLRSRATDAYSGLLRTSICRVGVSLAYVLVGVNAIWPRFEVLIFTFVVFCAIQAVWQLNSWADLRLARRLKSVPGSATVIESVPTVGHRPDP